MTPKNRIVMVKNRMILKKRLMKLKNRIMILSKKQVIVLRNNPSMRIKKRQTNQRMLLKRKLTATIGKMITMSVMMRLLKKKTSRWIKLIKGPPYNSLRPMNQKWIATTSLMIAKVWEIMMNFQQMEVITIESYKFFK